MTTSEACELVVDLIRQLAAACGERNAIKAELAATIGERDICREIVSVALTQLFERNRELERERTLRYRLIEEFRALRERRRNDTAA